MSSNLFL
jgi:ATP-dependent metalloprotease